MSDSSHRNFDLPPVLRDNAVYGLVIVQAHRTGKLLHPLDDLSVEAP